jgi:hypothetical protein
MDLLPLGDEDVEDGRGEEEKRRKGEEGLAHRGIKSMVQSGLDNPNPFWTKVESRVQFNRYVCGFDLLIRAHDHPKWKWWFISVWINES